MQQEPVAVSWIRFAMSEFVVPRPEIVSEEESKFTESFHAIVAETYLDFAMNLFLPL